MTTALLLQLDHEVRPDSKPGLAKRFFFKSSTVIETAGTVTVTVMLVSPSVTFAVTPVPTARTATFAPGTTLPLGSVTRPVREALLPPVTEHVQVADYEILMASLYALDLRVRIAVDDAGSGYAGLERILSLAPEVL